MKGRRSCPRKDCPFPGCSGMLGPDQNGGTEMARSDPAVCGCSRSQESTAFLKVEDREQGTDGGEEKGAWMWRA